MAEVPGSDRPFARKGHEAWASTAGWSHLGKCQGDERFIQRDISQTIINSLLDICHACPVEFRCLQWARAQILPVGFTVAGGMAWKDWAPVELVEEKEVEELDADR